MRSLARAAFVGCSLLASVVAFGPSAHAISVFQFEVNPVCEAPTGGLFSVDVSNGLGTPATLTFKVTDVDGTRSTDIVVPSGASTQVIPAGNAGLTSLAIYSGQSIIGGIDKADPCGIDQFGLTQPGVTVTVATRCVGTAAQVQYTFDSTFDGFFDLFPASFPTSGAGTALPLVTLEMGDHIVTEWANIPYPAGVVGAWQARKEVLGAPIVTVAIPDCSPAPTAGSGAGIPTTGGNDTPLLVTAFGLLGLGVVLQRVARRRTA